METNIDDVFALGECAQHRGVCYGLVEPAYEQARVLAARLCGENDVYEGSVVSTNLKVSGVSVFSAGDFLGSDGGETISWRDFGLGLYKKLVIDRRPPRRRRARRRHQLRPLVPRSSFARGADIAQWRDALIFGRALCERKAA